LQLSINGWHPIASHLVCIITGIALSNILSRQVRASSPPRAELTFSLNQNQTRSSKELSDDEIEVNVYKIAGQAPECKMFRNPLKARKIEERIVFTTTFADQLGLQHITKEMKLRNKVGIDKHLNKVPLCRTKPKVQYGS
jgi:hypothetical protein